MHNILKHSLLAFFLFSLMSLTQAQSVSNSNSFQQQEASLNIQKITEDFFSGYPGPIDYTGPEGFSKTFLDYLQTNTAVTINRDLDEDIPGGTFVWGCALMQDCKRSATIGIYKQKVVSAMLLDGKCSSNESSDRSCKQVAYVFVNRSVPRNRLIEQQLMDWLLSKTRSDGGSSPEIRYVFFG